MSYIGEVHQTGTGRYKYVITNTERTKGRVYKLISVPYDDPDSAEEGLQNRLIRLKDRKEELNQ